jgi:hypothetical protein
MPLQVFLLPTLSVELNCIFFMPNKDHDIGQLHVEAFAEILLLAERAEKIWASTKPLIYWTHLPAVLNVHKIMRSKSCLVLSLQTNKSVGLFKHAPLRDALLHCISRPRPPARHVG